MSFAFRLRPQNKKPCGGACGFCRPDFGQAAEEAHSDLAALASLRGKGLTPMLPPADPALAARMSITWTGPANEAIKQICLQTGYKYREIGSPSAQELAVIVNGLDRPCHELLEDVAWQIQPQGVLHVDPINRVITLARTQGAD